MTLVNQTIVHKCFGEGTIIGQDADRIYVKFSDKEREFCVPDAFINFIKCTDANLQAQLEREYAAKKEAEELERNEKIDARLRGIELTKQRNEITPVNVARNNRPAPRSGDDNNLAFKCNFCDGGCSENSVGFKGVCSNEQIKYNAEKRRYTWCSDPKCPCHNNMKGVITREELDAMNASGKEICHESRMLTEWIASAGEDLDVNGNIARGRRIQNASTDALAVLTTRLPNEAENQRIIFGVFITGKAYEGDENKAGYVAAKDGYTIELTPNEAKRMKFWNYHRNTKGGSRWGQGLFRYMKDDDCARILADIVAIKSGEEKTHAQKVLEYYCKLRNIDVNKIPTM